MDSSVRQQAEEWILDRPDAPKETVFGARVVSQAANYYRQELPNAAITDDVTGSVDADDRPADERTTELLDESGKLLVRIRDVKGVLDEADEREIVLIEE